MKNNIRKIVLAYSGGLDTSVMLRWLKEHYQCEVVCYCADVGQGAELSGLEEKAFATGASWVCYFRALKLGDASKVAPVDKLSVILVAIIAVVFLGERPSSREWLGISLVGLGVIILGFKR